MNSNADKVKTAILCNDIPGAISEIDNLIDSGFQVDDPLPYNPKGFENNWSLIFWASLSSTEEILRHLVEKHCAKVNARDANGYTPLLLAAFHGKVDAVKYFVAQGADLEAASNYEETLEELVLRKPVSSTSSNSRELELREYIQKLIRT